MLWRSEYETGNHKVDGQHKELFDNVERLLQSDELGDTQDLIYETFIFMIKYTTHHFATEEKLMIESDYPKYKEHKELHEEFVRTVQGFIEKYRADDTQSVEEVLEDYIVRWLKEHIMGEDKKMATYYREWRINEQNGEE